MIFKPLEFVRSQRRVLPDLVRLARIPSTRESTLCDRVVFLVGAGFLLFWHALLFARENFDWVRWRFAPSPADDAFGYLLKSTLLFDCEADCPARKSLQVDLSQPVGDVPAQWEQARQIHRLLYHYHPLHDALFHGLKIAGIGPEASYFLVGAAFLVAICVMIFAIARYVWGPLAGGIGLLLASSVQFSHEFATGSPSNVAVAAGLGAVAALLSKHRVGYVIAAMSLPLLLLLHPIGKIMAVMIALAALAFGLSDNRRAAISLCTFAGACIGSFLLVEHMVGAPWLRAPEFVDADPGWTILKGIRDNFRIMGQDVSHLLMARPSGVREAVFAAGLVLAYIGTRRLPAWRQARVILLGGGALAAALAGMFYLVPGYPPELFRRFWPYAGILLLGAVAAGGLHVWKSAPSEGNARRRMTGMIGVALCCVAANCYYSWTDTPRPYQRVVVAEYNAPACEAGEQHYFLEESLLYVGLIAAHGRCPVAFLPVVTKIVDPGYRQARLSRSGYLILNAYGISPTLRLPVGSAAPDTLTLTGLSAAHQSVITIEAWAATHVTLRGQQVSDVAVEPGRTKVTFVPDSAGTVRLRVSAGTIQLVGLQVDAAQSSTWPWSHSVKAQLRGREFSFDLESITRVLDAETRLVSDDGAFAIVWVNGRSR